MKMLFTISLILMSLMSSPSLGADFQKGFAAAQTGDFATALREWTPLAEQGDANAQFNLGIMYRKGDGVVKDYKTAVKWYTLAAEQGLANAQLNLGVMYDEGYGVLQDYKAAVKWYTLAAEQGLAKAQLNLGVMYGLGEGVIEDIVYAHIWANIASANGEEKGGEVRDLVAEKMTPSQLEKALDLARECVAKSYKNC